MYVKVKQHDSPRDHTLRDRVDHPLVAAGDSYVSHSSQIINNFLRLICFIY